MSKKIYLLRTENNLTQSEFAKIAGATDKAVSSWEKGTRSPKLQYTKPICEHFGIDLNTFIDESNDIYKPVLPPNATPIDLTSRHRIPILGRIAAGLPLYAEQNIEGYTLTDLNGGAEYFALRVSGDSMNAARIEDGDLIIVRRQEEVENGELAVVMVGDDDATVKLYVIQNVIQAVKKTWYPLSRNDFTSYKDCLLSRVSGVRISAGSPKRDPRASTVLGFFFDKKQV